MLKNKKFILSTILSTGFALFSMFFGSGNLLFPLRLGKLALHSPFLAGVGLMISGVILPMLGSYVVLCEKGSYKRFFRPLKRFGMLYFPFFLLLLMGPFGMIPRCIIVSYGSFQFIDVNKTISMPVFSIIMCVVIFLINLNPKFIIPFLGTFLTPALLLAMGFLSYHGVANITHEVEPIPLLDFYDMWKSFLMGLFDGYQTLDLLGSFFFASFVINHIQNKLKESNINVSQNNKGLTKFLTISSFFIAGALLTTIYFILILLGTIHGRHLPAGQEEYFLGILAQEVLGNKAHSVVCVIVILACLSTALALVTMFSEFFWKYIVVKKISLLNCSIITLVVSFILSLYGLKGVSALLTPILQWLYPPVILFTLYKFYLSLKKN